MFASKRAVNVKVHNNSNNAHFTQHAEDTSTFTYLFAYIKNVYEGMLVN